jgi:hypothetical protein
MYHIKVASGLELRMIHNRLSDGFADNDLVEYYRGMRLLFAGDRAESYIPDKDEEEAALIQAYNDGKLTREIQAMRNLLRPHRDISIQDIESSVREFSFGPKKRS